MPSPRPRLTLGRDRRLHGPGAFARLKATGGRSVQGCLIFNWLERPGTAASRAGFVVGRRVGGSVARSRARRLLREAFRLHQDDLARPIEAVLVARPSIAGRPFAAVERDYLRLLTAAGLRRPAAP
jgi:ribonuclease P protein component